jgi:hypothetical protein
MLVLIVAAVIVLATLADVDAPYKQLDRALPPLPDNVAAYEPIPRERMPFEQTQFAGLGVTLGERP